jgi:hypothetical protein
MTGAKLDILPIHSTFFEGIRAEDAKYVTKRAWDSQMSIFFYLRTKYDRDS